MASSSFPNSNSRWTCDVFLSFRGVDTRNGFTNHLHAALVRAGISTLRDDALQRGQEITPQLRKFVEKSRFSIIVLSKNYASSRWCLDELEHILTCRRTLGQTVWPIFYDIDPSDVRKQKRSFAEAFEEHAERFKDDIDKVTRWRAALNEVANLKGVDIRYQADGSEAENIENIVKEISHRLDRIRKLSVAIYPVGLLNRAKKVISKVLDKYLYVCVVGIYGIGGSGKTAIVKEVYTAIFHEFEASCFLANVRENSDDKGMIQLQRQLLSETLMQKHEEIYNVHRGLKVIEERLCHKKVLIVLDDVDELHQLNKLLGDYSWLSPGSRVIITTRTKDLLKPSRLYKQYEVQKLDHVESLQLFSLHAFGSVQPQKCFMECAKSVVNYAGGIPLVLEVLGSSLSSKDINVWNSTLEKLKKRGNEHIHTRLKISYDSLDDEQKILFLDIACFFAGFDKDYVISILYDFFPIAGINELVRRCLISIDFDNKLMMHDLIRDMGREIIRQESPMKPGNRSRLWQPQDVVDVLKDKTGTEEIEGLILNLSGQIEIFSTKAFKKMNRLRLLQLNFVYLTGSFEKFSRKLTWLGWHGFPLGTIPADLHLGNLVSLDMQYSQLNQFRGNVMYLGKLKFLDLSHSHVLTIISNFEGFPNLEILSLEDCTSLVELHDSIRVLTQLQSLNLQDCKSLRSLPSIGELRSLQSLNLQDCTSLRSLPENIGELSSLKNLDISGFRRRKIRCLHIANADSIIIS